MDHTSGAIARLYLMTTNQTTERNIVTAIKSQYFSIWGFCADHNLLAFCCFQTEIPDIPDRIFCRFTIIRKHIQFGILDC